MFLGRQEFLALPQLAKALVDGRGKYKSRHASKRAMRRLQGGTNLRVWSGNRHFRLSSKENEKVIAPSCIRTNSTHRPKGSPEYPVQSRANRSNHSLPVFVRV